MNVLMVGSRNFTDSDLLYRAFVSKFGMRGSYPNLRILSGGAEGADRLSERLAMSLDIPFQEYPANWKQNGKAAGFIRNVEMVSQADYVMVFFGPRIKGKEWPSKGASHTMEQAIKMGLPVEIHYQSWKVNQ